MKNKLQNARKIALVTSLALVGLFLSLGYIGPSNAAVRADWTFPSGYDPHGGYVDRIIFHVYPSTDIAQALLALQAGQVYAYDERLGHENVPELDADPDITVTSTVGIIYRQFTLQCERFPTNITGYRRALSFALDKHLVVENARGGYAEVMDNPIPLPITYWTYEPQMTEHYYLSDIAAANDSLEAAGFLNVTAGNPQPGWRFYDADDSGTWTAGDIQADDFAIRLWASAGYDPAIQAVSVLAANMAECGIIGNVIEIEFNALIQGLQTGDFDLGCFSWNINPPGTPDGVLNDFFRSDSGTNRFFYRYNSSEYDYNVTQFMDAPTMLEARNWAWNCSAILMQDMPMIVCYNDEYTHAYRTDVWEGYQEFIGLNRQSHRYALSNLRLKESAGGPWGCIPTDYVSVLSEGMDYQNILLSDSGYTDYVNGQIYETLYMIDPEDPDYGLQPGLAYNWTIRDTVPAGDVLTGRKFSFLLKENVTWHDGEDFTADDVAYSLGTIWQYGPWDSEFVENIYLTATDGDYNVTLYTTNTGYVEFSRATSLPILPKHIWEPNFNFTTWTPTTRTDYAGTGPFMWTVRVPQQYIILERNPTWHLGVEMPDDRVACPAPFNPFIFIGIGVAVIVIIIIAGVYFFRIRK